MPVNHESDSVDQIQRLADQFGEELRLRRGSQRRAQREFHIVRVVRSTGAAQG